MLNYPPVAYTGFWRFMPQFLSKYMGIRLSPCIIYRGILDTGHSVLIEPATYTFFDVLNLTSETVIVVFLSLLCDIGAIGTPFFF